MRTNHLTPRLSSQDVSLMENLRVQTGMSKSGIVKHALRTLASKGGLAAPAGQGLFALGESRFGKHGDAKRQSADMKSVVHAQVLARHKA